MTLIYARDPKTKVRTVRVNVPTNRWPGLSDREVGPFPVPYGKTPEMPKEVRDLLEDFAVTGPGRLSERFRDLVKELLRAGAGVDDVHRQVDLALAESVMEA